MARSPYGVVFCTHEKTYYLLTCYNFWSTQLWGKSEKQRLLTNPNLCVGIPVGRSNKIGWLGLKNRLPYDKRRKSIENHNKSMMAKSLPDMSEAFMSRFKNLMISKSINQGRTKSIATKYFRPFFQIGSQLEWVCDYNSFNIVVSILCEGVRCPLLRIFYACSYRSVIVSSRNIAAEWKYSKYPKVQINVSI